MTIKKPLKKVAMMTDIHWGKKNNSEEHNSDCMRFIDWFIEQVKADPEIDHIAFLGDWHENRSSLNLETLKQSFIGAKKLNDLGMPVYFIVGNHDLYHRHTRDTHSLHHLDELENFIMIDDVYVADDTEIAGGALFAPYLFSEEYATLNGYNKIPVWLGHFEFKGFVVTGYNVVMPTGPEKEDFTGPTHIFSGHFHKRQNQKNIYYIGNTFPMDFGDAGDTDRGCAIFNYETKDLNFVNWEDCPKYVKVRLSDVLDDKVKFDTNTRVNCTVDIALDYEESTSIREKMMDTHSLREFVLDETIDVSTILEEVEQQMEFEDGATLDQLVIEMLRTLEVDQVDNEFLIECYKELKSG